MLGQADDNKIPVDVVDDDDDEGGPETSQHFGRFQLLARLARGGMGDVYLALANGAMGFNKLVVIKRLRSARAAQPSIRDMFLDEGRLAARLNHPNVVQTNDVGCENGVYFLAMEYLDGQPLNGVLRRSTDPKRAAIPPQVCARIVADALQGLHYAHELKDFDGTPLSIVHRDLSPHNIFITYDGVVKLVDFGIAKATMHSSNKTEVGVLKGKLAYMAPEQLLAESADRRADLFTMGIVLWEVVARQRLFHGASELVTATKLLHTPIPRLSSVVPDVDPMLDDLVARALEKDRELRFQTALEMREALEAYIVKAGSVRQDEIGRLVCALFEKEREENRTKIQEYIADARAQTSGPLPTLTFAEQSSPSLVVASMTTTSPSGVSSVVSSGVISKTLVTASATAAPASEASLPPPAAVRSKLLLPVALGALLVAGIALGLTLGRQGATPAPAAPAAGVAANGAIVTPTPAQPVISAPIVTSPSPSSASSASSAGVSASSSSSAAKTAVAVPRWVPAAPTPPAPPAPAARPTVASPASPTPTTSPVSAAPKPPATSSRTYNTSF